MDKSNIFDASTGYEDEIVSFQIGQCRLIVDIRRTKDFYAILPAITTNCSCGNCKYFENQVLRHTNRLFTILSRMGVDLSRQPNINPDGISCVGETKPGKIGYMGYYFVYGLIGKTQKKGVKKTDTDQLVEVEFNDVEFGKDTQVTIKQVEQDKLSFEFYMEVPIEASI
jgi:hypothetical protein